LGGPRYATSTVLNNGRIVVVHEDYNNVNAAFATILNSDGSVFVPSIAIAPYPMSGFNQNPDVIALADGGFLYSSNFQTTFVLNAHYIPVRFYNAAGTFIRQVDFGANVLARKEAVDIEQLEGGRIVVTWSETPQGQTGQVINVMRAAIVNPDGTIARAEWTLESNAFDNSVTALKNGNFAAVWESNSDIKVGVFEANGNTVSAPIIVGKGDVSDVVTLSDGRFAVAWEATLPSTSSTPYAEVMLLKVFNANGTVSIDTTQVAVLDWLTRDLNMDLEALPNGQLLISWSDQQTITEVHAMIVDVDAGSSVPTQGNDFLTGTVNQDSIYGLGGNDTINGIGGPDWLYGGAGNDALIGGDGNDQLTGGVGADTHNGGAGFDYARYDDAASSITARLDIPTANTGEALGDTYVDIEGLVGGDFDDTLVGNAEANRLWGLAGNDWIYGLSDDDILYGNDGADQLTGGAGADTLDGGAGFDYARYDDAATAITARLDIPTANTGEALGDTYVDIEGLVGGGFDDTLVGNAEANRLWGLAGNDWIYGLNGNDILYGNDGSDQLTGGAGADTLDGGAGFDFARYDAATTAITARLDIAALNTGEAVGDTYVDIEGLVGGAFDDTIVGDATANRLWGLDGDDEIYGLNGSDVLYGGNGADQLFGGLGNDTLDGGTGNDRIIYDAADVAANVNGGADSDTLVVVGGTLPIGFNLVASAFEQAEWQQTDTAGQSWSTILGRYNSNWQITSSSTKFDNGMDREMLFDYTTAITWKSRQLDYAAPAVGGALTYDYFIFDNLSSRDTTYDTDPATSYKSVRNDYDASGFRTYNYMIFEDNSSRDTSFDKTTDIVWQSLRQDYTASGALSYQYYVFDNNTARQVVIDVANQFSWNTQVTNYNAAGQVVEFFVT
jgi:Ca2+-binding RTX toxin-like protein